MDPLLAFADKLLLLLAAVPGSDRPDRSEKPARWEKLLRELLTVERGWPLALLIAGWYFKRQKPGASPALGTLRAVEGVPAVWLRFDQAQIRGPLQNACKEALAAQAPWERAGAAASWGFVLHELSQLEVGEALGGLVFRALARSLSEALPPPADLGTRLQAALARPGASAAAVPKSAAARSPLPASVATARRDGPPVPPSISTPQLSEPDQCVAYLASRGYTPAQIAALCGGPRREPSEGEA